MINARSYNDDEKEDLLDHVDRLDLNKKVLKKDIIKIFNIGTETTTENKFRKKK